MVLAPRREFHSVMKSHRELRPLDNLPQSIRPRFSDSVVDKRTMSNLWVVDKRTKTNFYDVKSWVHIFRGSFGSIVDKITRV